MIILGLFIGFIIGVIVSAMVGNGDEDCPRVVMGYNCREWSNKDCDHSEVELRKCQLRMAEAREKAKTPAGRRELGLPNIIKKDVKKEQQK